MNNNNKKTNSIISPSGIDGRDALKLSAVTSLLSRSWTAPSKAQQSGALQRFRSISDFLAASSRSEHVSFFGFVAFCSTLADMGMATQSSHLR